MPGIVLGSGDGDVRGNGILSDEDEVVEWLGRLFLGIRAIGGGGGVGRLTCGGSRLVARAFSWWRPGSQPLSESSPVFRRR